MIRAYTEFSVYEIDMKNKRIRRTIGVNAPTPRQGEDNVWRDFEGIAMKEDGILIQWPGTNDNGTFPATWTSAITQIESDEGELNPDGTV